MTKMSGSDESGPIPMMELEAEDTQALRTRMMAIRKARPKTLTQKIKHWGAVAGGIVGIVGFLAMCWRGYQGAKAELKTRLDNIATKDDIATSIKVHIGSFKDSIDKGLAEHGAKIGNHEGRLQALEARRRPR